MLRTEEVKCIVLLKLRLYLDLPFFDFFLVLIVIQYFKTINNLYQDLRANLFLLKAKICCKIIDLTNNVF